MNTLWYLLDEVVAYTLIAAVLAVVFALLDLALATAGLDGFALYVVAFSMEITLGAVVVHRLLRHP